MIKKINIAEAKNLRGLGNNINQVSDFMLYLANELNRVVDEINANTLTYDDSEIKAQINAIHATLDL